MTDVNIAEEFHSDAQDDAFDAAIIISGDGDLASPVRAISERDPEKRAVVAFPAGTPLSRSPQRGGRVLHHRPGRV